jgi:nickel transport system substrate-binding protein
MDGSLDAVIGGGVLSEAVIALLKYNNSANVSVSLTESIQNRIIVFNTDRTPTDDLQNRKVIIHAIDKAKIIDEEFAGLADVAESLFPKNAPYCGADLTPKPDYDIEKAQLLNCPTETEISTEGKKTELSKAVIAVIAILCVAFITVGVVLAFMYTREKAGNPLFQPLNPSARSDEPDMESNSYEVKM